MTEQRTRHPRTHVYCPWGWMSRVEQWNIHCQAWILLWHNIDLLYHRASKPWDILHMLVDTVFYHIEFVASCPQNSSVNLGLSLHRVHIFKCYQGAAILICWVSPQSLSVSLAASDSGTVTLLKPRVPFTRGFSHCPHWQTKFSSSFSRLFRTILILYSEPEIWVLLLSSSLIPLQLITGL